MPQVAVGVKCAKVFAAPCFSMKRGLNFCGNILGVHIILDVLERRNIHAAGLVQRVNAIVQGNVAYMALREINLGVLPAHDVVTSKAGEVSLCQLNTKFFTDARGGQQVFPRPPPASALS